MDAVRLAFVPGAVAAGFAAAALVALLTLVIRTLLGATGSWGAAGWAVLLIGLIVGVLTFIAEGIARARTLARMRASGEPWAYRP